MSCDRTFKFIAVRTTHVCITSVWPALLRTHTIQNVIKILTFSQWDSGVLEYPKKYLEDLTTFFMSTWWGDSKNMEEIEFSRWLFEGRLRQGKNVLPDGLNWLCYFAGNSKSHRENSISFIFLEFPHQVSMKNVVKYTKQFFRLTVLTYILWPKTWLMKCPHLLEKAGLGI